MVPAVLSEEIVVTGNSNKTLDSSAELVVCCPYMEKTSSISDAPMFEPVARVFKSSLKALVIVLSFVALYFLIAII